jgi:hypothetical protein
MAQKFPKYKLRADEPIAHEEINYNLRAVKDELGRLNEHNIAGGAFSSRTHVDPDFAIQINSSSQEFDPFLNFGDGTGIGDYPAETAVPPAPYADDRITIDGSTEWQVIMTATKFTSNSLLWVLVSFQQQVYGPAPGTNPGGLYALRIDGTIIDEVRTGGTDRSNDPVGGVVSCQAYPYVLDLVIPLAPGSHTIELVGRALEGSGVIVASWLQFPNTFYTMVFNRELILITLDPESASVNGDMGDFLPLEEGDTISALNIRAPFDDILADYNDIEYPSIQPESLTAEHCPSTVLDAGQVTVGTLVTHSYTNAYPGYAVDTIGAPGWAVIDDGTDPLEVFITSVDTTDSTIRGILIGVDLNVINIDPSPAVTTQSDLTYAAIALQYRDNGGVWRTVGRTERYVNSEYDTNLNTQLALRKNIGFRTLLEASDIGGNGAVDGLRAVVSGYDRKIITTFTVELQQASLWYAVLQGGS